LIYYLIGLLKTETRNWKLETRKSKLEIRKSAATCQWLFRVSIFEFHLQLPPSTNASMTKSRNR